MELSQVDVALKIAYTAAGLLTTAAGLFHWYVVRPIKKKVAKIDKIDTLSARLALIEKDLKPNGGSSLRDVVDQIAKSVHDLTSMLTIQRQRTWALLDRSDEAMFETDPHGRCIWANRAYLKIISRTIDDVRDAGWLSYICEEHRGEVRSEWRSAIEDVRSFDARFCYILPDGRDLAVWVRASPLAGPDGKVEGFVGRLELDNTPHS